MRFYRINGENANQHDYDKIVKETPVFVKIYSPMCGHCVSMQSAWDALENHSDLKNYNISLVELRVDAIDKISSLSAKIDMGVPTLRMVKLNGNEWIEYQGDRSTQDMIKFIKENYKNMAGIKLIKKGKSESKTLRKIKSKNNRKLKYKTSRKRKSKNNRKTKRKSSRK
jgi:thioredoxin-like negative regulator of GroEL